MAHASLPHFKSVIKLDHYKESKQLALISSSSPSRLVRMLLKSGHTEESLACVASVSQSTISRILSGKTRDPRFSVIQKLLTCLEQESVVPQT